MNPLLLATVIAAAVAILSFAALIALIRNIEDALSSAEDYT